MDFFERQEDARRRSRRLLFLYVPLVGAMCLGPAAVYAVIFESPTVSACLSRARGNAAGSARERAPGGAGDQPASGARVRSPECTPRAFGKPIAIAGGLALLIVFGSWLKMRQLRKDAGTHLSALLGARLVFPRTGGLPEEARLYNVVEEMCIASGAPLPRVYLLPGEGSINAFAAGSDVLDASVFVTAGALERLTREELQGVIGHELGHVLSGDVRVNMRLIGLLHGILLVSEFGEDILQWTARSRRDSSSRRGGGNPLILVGLSIWLLGILGVLCAKLLKAGFSRQREWAADALSAQFTRNPHGLASALARIGAEARDGRAQLLTAAHAEQVSHMCFAKAVKALIPFFETHPPLEERIRALGGDASRLVRGSRAAHAGIPGSPSGFAALTGSTTASTASTAPGSALWDSPPVPSAPSQGATPSSPSLPPLRTPEDARVAFLGVLLWQNPSFRAAHLAFLSRCAPAPFVARVETFAAAYAPRDASEVMATCDLSISRLRALAPGERKEFVRGLEAFVGCDGTVSFFETCVVGLARSLLGAHAGLSLTISDPARLIGSVRVLVSMLAWVRTGFSDDDEADGRRMALYIDAMEAFAGPCDGGGAGGGAGGGKLLSRHLSTSAITPELVWTALETVSLGRPALRARVATAAARVMQGPGASDELRIFARVIALHLNATGLGRSPFQ